MNTYYAVRNDNGPISIRIIAENKDQAIEIMSGFDPQTIAYDFEKDFGVHCPGDDDEDFEMVLTKHGFCLVKYVDPWELWG